jgi:hypothetical protein
MLGTEPDMKTLMLEYWLPLLVTSLAVIFAMRQPDKKAFLKEYGLPLLIITTLAVAFEIGGAWVLVCVPVAFLVGLAFRPRHIWVPWLGILVALWTGFAVMWLTGNWPWQDPTHGETLGSVAIEVVVFTAVLVLLPLISGKFLRVVAELLRAAATS